MRKFPVVLMMGALAATCVAAQAQTARLSDADVKAEAALREYLPLFAGPEHVHMKKGFTQLDLRAHGSSSPVMLFHGGTILTSNKTEAIFWGSQWTSASFAGDIITGLDSFFGGFGGSRFAGTSTEYTGTNGQVTTSSTYLGHVIDSSTAPSKAISTSTAVAEACKITGNNPDPSALYLLYTSTTAGHVSYCAWHSYGNCSNGAPVQVAYMPYIGGQAGCDPADTWTTHSQPLAALVNVTSHELSETITDPRNGGWYDSSGGENGDKCAWSFSGPVTLKNSSVWKLQMEWSNNAYNNGTGLANLSGQKGCLQGQ